MNTNYLLQAANEAASAFETRTRATTGERFVCLKDEARDGWLTEAVRQCHNGAMPNDWIYEACRGVTGSLLDLIKHDDDLADKDHEIADGLVEVRTYKLRKWAADEVCIADEGLAQYREEIGPLPADLDDQLKVAQYVLLASYVRTWIVALEDRAMELEVLADSFVVMQEVVSKWRAANGETK